MIVLSRLWQFVAGSLTLTLRGNAAYWGWIVALLMLILSGAMAYSRQLSTGLVLTAMRDPVSWGFYIGNFTFLVGVAAAAVVLVIPAYVYHWKPIREVVIFGELLAISAILMCMMFVMVDVGRPDRVWHLIPGIGYLNFPSSLLAWDVIVLNVYLVINVVVVTHILYRAFHGRPYDKRLVVPLVLLSIPMAVAIHTVTAFLYNGMAARPYWNASILAPQFLASAFCSGPAILLLVLQLLRRFTRFEIQDQALHKIAELMAYAMFLNLFLHGAEAFKEFYSDTEHLLYTRYWFTGLGEHRTLVPYAWAAVALNLLAFVLFILPAARRNWIMLNIGCLAIYAGVYIEKGMGLIIPGFTPSTLGEIYEYSPTMIELRVAGGIFAIGFLVFTVMLKVAVPILLGEFEAERAAPYGGSVGVRRAGGGVRAAPVMRSFRRIIARAGGTPMTRTMLIVALIGLGFPQYAWAQDALVQKGQQVYAARKCSMCHSVAGKGNPKGSLDGVGSKWTADELREWIVNWKEMAAKHNATRKPPMTDYSKLPKGDVDALVAYLQTLK